MPTIQIDTAKIKARVYARVEQELADTIDQHRRKLGITKQEFMVRAIVAELGRFDVRMVLKLTTDERDKLRKEIDRVAAHFNCPQNGNAILYEVEELDAKMELLEKARDKALKDYQTACEWRNRYKAERNQSQNETHQARQQRDTFKAKYEDSRNSCEIANTVIQAYQRQSWLARLFGIKPKVV